MKNRDSASKRLITSSLGLLEEEEDSLEEELGSMEEEEEEDGSAEEEDSEEGTSEEEEDGAPPHPARIMLAITRNIFCFINFLQNVPNIISNRKNLYSKNM